jgi:hypothetical protein
LEGVVRFRVLRAVVRSAGVVSGVGMEERRGGGPLGVCDEDMVSWLDVAVVVVVAGVCYI